MRSRGGFESADAGSPESLRQRFGALSAVPRTFTHRVEGRDILLSRRYAADAWNLNVDTELARFAV